MKKLFACLVLIICYVVVATLETLACQAVMWFIGEITQMSTLAMVLVLVFGGSMLLGIILAPIFYGSMLTILASEAVDKSPSGTRYWIFSAIVMVITLVCFVGYLILMSTINIPSLLVLVYCVMLLVGAKGIRDESIVVQ